MGAEARRDLRQHRTRAREVGARDVRHRQDQRLHHRSRTIPRVRRGASSASASNFRRARPCRSRACSSAPTSRSTPSPSSPPTDHRFSRERGSPERPRVSPATSAAPSPTWSSPNERAPDDRQGAHPTGASIRWPARRARARCRAAAGKPQRSARARLAVHLLDDAGHQRDPRGHHRTHRVPLHRGLPRHPRPARGRLAAPL